MAPIFLGLLLQISDTGSIVVIERMLDVCPQKYAEAKFQITLKTQHGIFNMKIV